MLYGRNPSFNWTPERDARLIELFNMNELTLKEVAYALGCGWGAVRSRLSKLRQAGRVGTKRASTR